MATAEDSVLTVIRLLDNNMKLTKADGSVGSVYVSEEWYNRALMKNHDAQVTVGLERSTHRKLGFSASLRLDVGFLRVILWVINKTSSEESPRAVRDKMRKEIKRIITEKRTKPNITEYSFWNLGITSKTHKAYEAAADAELAPDNENWGEIEGEGYNKIWVSDYDRYSVSADENSDYGLMLFRFKVGAESKVLTNLELAFEGYGTAPGGNGATIKVWNFSSSSWENAQSGTADTDETLTITLSSGFSDLIDSNGYVYLLAQTTNPSNGSTDAVLHCDFVKCTITVQGIHYVDVVSFKDSDDIEVNPVIWRTEFVLKTWLFENIPVT